MTSFTIFERTDEFKRQYLELPLPIQKKFDKTLRLLKENTRHPSLHLKKIQGSDYGEWEGRVDIRYRFIFVGIPQGIRFLAIGPHKIIERRN